MADDLPESPLKCLAPARPKEVMSSGDMTALFGRSSLGKKVLVNAFEKPKPCSWIVKLNTARMVENIRLMEEVDKLRSINQSLNLAAFELE